MIDVDSSLTEVSSDSPCGENMEYDPLFGEMERAATGKPEQQFGNTIIPAEEPKWRDVQKIATELIEKTKDLRVATEFARAELATSGLPAFTNSLALIRGYLERYWLAVHPQLDPDDGNDPATRVNVLESLCDEARTLRLLRQMPIVSSRTFGRFSLRDVAIADGELPAPEGVAEPPDWTKINAAFEETSVDDIKTNSTAVVTAIDHVNSIQRTFSSEVGAGNGVNFRPLMTVLQAADKVFSGQLTRRGVSLVEEEAAPEEGSGDAESNGKASSKESANRLSGTITTRDDVLVALQKITEYYAKYEPSSPLPLLLQRCKRLVSASFLEIIQDLAPDVLGQISAMGGQSEE
jgi:type VI secretion system protein ImpA